MFAERRCPVVDCDDWRRRGDASKVRRATASPRRPCRRRIPNGKRIPNGESHRRRPGVRVPGPSSRRRRRWRGRPPSAVGDADYEDGGGGWILTVMHRGHAFAGGGCAMSVSASTGDSATCYVLNVIYRYNLNVIYHTSSPLSESNILPEIERACNSVQSDSNFDEVMPAARVLPAHLVQGCAIVVIGDLF